MPLPCSPLSSDEEHAATRTANAKREGSVIYTLRDFLLLLLGLLAAILIFVGLLSRNIPWSTNHPGLYKCLRVRGSIRIQITWPILALIGAPCVDPQHSR